MAYGYASCLLIYRYQNMYTNKSMYVNFQKKRKKKSTFINKLLNVLIDTS